MAIRQRIGLRQVRALKLGETIWDGSLAGFGARRQQSAAISYVLYYRTQEGRQRWHTIGRHGAPWTPDTARVEAQRVLGEVAGGDDPAAIRRNLRKAASVAELCDLYLKDVESGRILIRRKRRPKKSSTIDTDRGRIERHIKPLLGQHKVSAVTRKDIESFMHDVTNGKTAGKTKTTKKRGLAHVRGGKGTASRTVGLLGAIFTYAVDHGMRADNPVHGVTRPADGVKERRLGEEAGEFAAFGKAIRLAEKEVEIWPAAIRAAHFLALSGWRSGEALDLRWRDVDLVRRTALLPDTKSDGSVRPLSRLACNALGAAGPKDALVFPPTRGARMSGFRSLWDKITKLGGLPTDITPKVLRHTFSSVGSDLGFSDVTVGALTGHKNAKTVTARNYMHPENRVLFEAADAIATRIAELMGEPQRSGAVVELHGASV